MIPHTLLVDRKLWDTAVEHSGKVPCICGIIYFGSLVILLYVINHFGSLGILLFLFLVWRRANSCVSLLLRWHTLLFLLWSQNLLLGNEKTHRNTERNPGKKNKNSKIRFSLNEESQQGKRVGCGIVTLGVTRI